jgi:tubulysin polyketide synthase-like protein
MTARELLSQLREKGVELSTAGGDRLVIDAPKGTITPELRSALAENKSELIKILSAPAVESRPAAPEDGGEPPVLAKEPGQFHAPEPEEAPRLDGSTGEEIKQLEVELMRLRTEEEARRAEVEAGRLAVEHALSQERQRWRQSEEEAARRRAEQERLRIEAEARERAAEETRQRIAEDELARVEEELKRMRAMEEARRAEVEAQFRATADSHHAELQTLRAAEAEQARLRAEEERRHLEAEARKRAQEDEIRRRAQMRIAAVEEEILRVRLREDARLKSAEEARLLTEETQRRRAEEEARRQAEAEARRRAEEEEQLRAQIEAQMRAEAEARRKAEEETRKRAEEDARRRAEEEAERLAAEQARRLAEEEALRRAEEESRREMEAEARRRAEEASRRQAEEQARLRAEEGVKLRAENEVRQRAELEARIRAEVEAKLRAEEAERPALDEARCREEEARLRTEADRSREAAGLFRGGEESEFQPVSVPETADDYREVSAEISDTLSTRTPRERADAIADLASERSEESFAQISAAFDDSSPEVRNAAARALFDFQEDRAAAFTRALRAAPAERRPRIGAAIASSGLANTAIGNLTGESRDKTYDAFSLLFLMSKAGEIQPLMRAIEEHPNSEVRLAVVKLLALSGQPDVLPAFRRMAVRGTLPPEIRSAVMEAIYQITSQSGGQASPPA